MGELLAIWWVWLSAALVLALIEVLLPAFVFLGFAIGAAVMAILVLFLPVTLSAPVALAIFAGLSLIAWIALRLIFRNQRSGARFFQHDIND